MNICKSIFARVILGCLLALFGNHFIPLTEIILVNIRHYIESGVQWKKQLESKHIYICVLMCVDCTDREYSKGRCHYCPC